MYRINTTDFAPASFRSSRTEEHRYPAELIGVVHWLGLSAGGSTDTGGVAVGIYEGFAEEAFAFTFETDEVVFVLEGAAEVELQDGSLQQIGPGDLIFWPAGSTVTWRYLAPMREIVYYTGCVVNGVLHGDKVRMAAVPAAPGSHVGRGGRGVGVGGRSGPGVR